MNQQQKIVNLHGLQVVVLPGNGSSDQNSRRYYEGAYETWKTVWKETLLELDGSDSLYSDHYTRQDYVLAVFHGSRCAALCCFRRADLTQQIDLDDSWFKPWKLEDLKRFSVETERGLVVSWLTIHPDYRRSISTEHLKDFNASERLCEQINFFMQDCPMDIGFGVTRNNRSVNKMAQYVGFTVHQPQASLHGVEVDLITINHRQLREAQASYPETALDLWNKRTVFPSETLQLFSQTPARTRLKVVS
jgi:hypothetical protein